jgi:4'-phosphopantetheinyl transferase
VGAVLERTSATVFEPHQAPIWPPVTVDSAELERGSRLWLVALDRMPESTALLDSCERARLARLRSRRQAIRYVARRSALRLVLAAALEIAPQRVPLETGSHGKPRIAAETSLSFNVSNRGATAVIALARGVAVGVDIESARPHGSPQRLAARFFHPDEAAEIAALPAALAADAFLRCWTAKEALLKAIGVGLGERMREVVLTADPREPLRLRRVPGPLDVADWTLHELCVRRHRLTLALAQPRARIAAVDALPSA